MGSGISVIKRCATLLTQNSTKQVIQALILSNLDYCPVVWSNATMNKIKQLQTVQNRAARIALHCEYRTNVITIHNCLSWLFVKGRLLYSLLVFIRNILVKKTPVYLYENLSVRTNIHDYSTRYAVEGTFLLLEPMQSRKQSCTKLCMNGIYSQTYHTRKQYCSI